MKITFSQTFEIELHIRVADAKTTDTLLDANKFNYTSCKTPYRGLHVFTVRVVGIKRAYTLHKLLKEEKINFVN